MIRGWIRRAGPVSGLITGLIVATVIALGIWGFTSRHGGTTRVSAPKSTPTETNSPAPTPTAAPASAAGTPTQAAVVCPPATRQVHDAAGLQQALTAARVGDVIGLADGTYIGHFTAKAHGTATEPIYLCGSRGAILDGGGVKSGYVLHMDGAAYWRVSGFTVRNGQKGVVADHLTASIIDKLDVGHVGDEGIHLRASSTNNVVENNDVHDTGLHSGKFGEGIYIGSAKSNWCTYAGCQADRSDNNLIAANTIFRTTAENLDIKEGTTAGTIRGNHFDAAGMTSADSWVDVKGNGWTITANTGSGSGSSTTADGYQTHEILPGWGAGNVFTANTGKLASSGYAFHLTPVNTNQVGCDNRISGPSKGQSNTTCTKAPAPDTKLVSTTDTSSSKHHRARDTPSPTPTP